MVLDNVENFNQHILNESDPHVPPVRFRGLSGSRGWRLGDEGGAEGHLGERGPGWWTGRLGDSGPMQVTVWDVGLVGEGACGCSSCTVLEGEETLQDLRRGKASVGWTRPWDRVLGIFWWS